MIVSLFLKKRRITFRYSDDLARVIPRSHRGFRLGAIRSSRVGTERVGAKFQVTHQDAAESDLDLGQADDVDPTRSRPPASGLTLSARPPLSPSRAKAHRCGAAAPLTDRRTTASGGWRRAAYPAKSGRGLAGRSATGLGGFRTDCFRAGSQRSGHGSLPPGVAYPSPSNCSNRSHASIDHMPIVPKCQLDVEVSQAWPPTAFNVPSAPSCFPPP